MKLSMMLSPRDITGQIWALFFRNPIKDEDWKKKKKQLYMWLCCYNKENPECCRNSEQKQLNSRKDLCVEGEGGYWSKLVMKFCSTLLKLDFPASLASRG
ncbi:hypothetical protein H1C71_009942 [Ictidomys tridecemlineatus]|nr:hypothetical protein H1C71_009942 [Ictidomys tridecemlineatus]